MVGTVCYASSNELMDMMLYRIRQAIAKIRNEGELEPLNRSPRPEVTLSSLPSDFIPKRIFIIAL
jgi:hypothetical protein